MRQLKVLLERKPLAFGSSGYESIHPKKLSKKAQTQKGKKAKLREKKRKKEREDVCVS